MVARAAEPVAPMLRRRQGARGFVDTGKRIRLPPIEFDGALGAGFREQVGVPKRRDKHRVVAGGQHLDGREVEMIVVIVAEQDGINTWKVGQRRSRSVGALGTEPAYRTRAIRKHRIDQEVQARGLEEKTRMANPRNDDAVAARRRWRRLRRQRNAFGPRRTATGK